MSALTSPTFSWSNRCQSTSPFVIASLASRTHSGQSESVWRGQPREGLVFCQDFSSGFWVHFGVNVGAGLNRLKYWIVSKATPAPKQSAASTYFIIRLLSLGFTWFRVV